MPLLAARLIHYEGLIEEIHDHMREVSLERIETLENEVEILRDRVEAAKQIMPTTRQGMNTAAIEQLIALRIANAMKSYNANRASGNGTHNEASGSARGIEHMVHNFFYKEFLICKPHNSKGRKELLD
ncbi:hypothetical protein Tco_0808413 [Tanacetum coccineum]